MKTTVTHVGIAVFVVFSVLVSSSWAAKFTDKDVSGNRQNGTLKRQHNWEIKTSNGLNIPEGWELFGYDNNDEQDPFLLRRQYYWQVGWPQ